MFARPLSADQHRTSKALQNQPTDLEHCTTRYNSAFSASQFILRTFAFQIPVCLESASYEKPLFGNPPLSLWFFSGSFPDLWAAPPARSLARSLDRHGSYACGAGGGAGVPVAAQRRARGADTAATAGRMRPKWSSIHRSIAL